MKKAATKRNSAKLTVYTGDEVVRLFMLLRRVSLKELGHFFDGARALQEVKEHVRQETAGEDMVQYICDEDSIEIDLTRDERAACVEAIEQGIKGGLVTLEDGLHLKTLRDKLKVK